MKSMMFIMKEFIQQSSVKNNYYKRSCIYVSFADINKKRKIVKKS